MPRGVGGGRFLDFLLESPAASRQRGSYSILVPLDGVLCITFDVAKIKILSKACSQVFPKTSIEFIHAIIPDGSGRPPAQVVCDLFNILVQVCLPLWSAHLFKKSLDDSIALLLG
jgi:hypothetical protein